MTGRILTTLEAKRVQGIEKRFSRLKREKQRLFFDQKPICEIKHFGFMVVEPNGDQSFVSFDTYFLNSKLLQNENSNRYERICRCGSVFTITQAELDNIFKRNESNAESFVLGLECDTCSIVINVLII